MDEMFDLDMALTMPEDYSNTELDKQHDNARHLVDEMPMVVAGGDEHCAVCMEAFRSCSGGGVGKQVRCGHVFHENCIFEWLSITDSCPLCRSKVQLSL